MDVRDASNIPKTSMALQKFIYTQIKNGAFDQVDDDVKRELQQLQKATFSSLKTADLMETTDCKPDDTPEDTMAAVYHQTGGELLSETKATILTMEELSRAGLLFLARARERAGERVGERARGRARGRASAWARKPTRRANRWQPI